LTRRLLAVAGLVLAAGFGAAAASGHGLDVEVRLHSPVVVLRAAYSGAEAVAYAAVKIYAPGASTVEFQSGNADASGRFAFVPDHEGEWRAVVDDELGHREERRISIGRDFFATGAGVPGKPAAFSGAGGPESLRSRLPLWLRALVGLAFIFGGSGFLYGFKARCRTGK
jgi:nickel transport protein